MNAEEKEREISKLAIEQKRINEFRSSMQKQLKMLESVPAREVNLFIAQNQEKAASKIQAAYRGMVGRRIFRERQHDVTRERAAIAIQRQVMCVKCRIATSFSGSLFSTSTTKEAEKRDPGNEVGRIAGLLLQQW